MGVLNGTGRIWGTASPRYWAHLDPHRPWKRVALVVDVGERMQPFITPDDPARVLEIVDSHRATG
jgi:hypothetical protein